MVEIKLDNNLIFKYIEMIYLLKKTSEVILVNNNGKCGRIKRGNTKNKEFGK